MIPFSKYSGCGNDFIIFDNRDILLVPRAETIQKICSRRLGVGADGVLLLENSTIADFRMRIFNDDGSEAEMCGNGARCMGKFLGDIGFPKEKFSLETLNSVIQVNLSTNQPISIQMPPPLEIRWDISLSIEKENFLVHYLDIGVPHAVIFHENIETVNVAEWGCKVRFHPLFAPRGTNVNFVELMKEKNLIKVRTYERGVEKETDSCGTGSVAAALLAAQRYHLNFPIQVVTRTQEYLEVKETPLSLSGPAQQIFTGYIQTL